MSALSTAVLFGLLSMLGYGLDNALSQPVIRSIGSAKTIFFRNVLIAALLFLAFLLMPGAHSHDMVYALMALALGVLGYLPVLAFFEALKVGKLGVVSPITSSQVAFTVTLALVFFGEAISIAQIASIAAIIAGVFFLSFRFDDWKKPLSKDIAAGVPLALAASALWGVLYFLLKIPVLAIGPYLTSALMEAGVLAACGAHLALSRQGFRAPAKGLFVPIALIAITGAAGTLFFNMGVEIAQVSIVAALSMSFPLVATLYGHFVYKDRLSRLQWLAAGVVICGAVALQLLA